MGDSVETPAEVVHAFVTAVETAMREMAGIEVVPMGVRPAAGADDFADLSVVLKLTSGAVGCFVLSLPTATADAIGRRILAEVMPDPPPDLIRDCMGEVANVIAGQAKSHLAGTQYHFLFETPKGVTGRPDDVGPSDWLVEFKSEAGAFTFHMCLDG